MTSFRPRQLVKSDALSLALVVCLMNFRWEWTLLTAHRNAVLTNDPGYGSDRSKSQGIRATTARASSSQLPVHLQNASKRSQRFPSVDDRVRLYMSDWYLPPCQDIDRFLQYFSYSATSQNQIVLNPNREGPRTLIFYSTEVPVDIAFSLDFETIMKCSQYHDHRTMRSNCRDAVSSVLPALDSFGWNLTEANRSSGLMPPLLFQFGDYKQSHAHGYLPIPVIKKFRSSLTNEQMQRITNGTCSRNHPSTSMFLHPIIWKLGTNRHYGSLPSVPLRDIPWRDKQNRAVFRGAMARFQYKANSTDVAEHCHVVPRCRLVYQYTSSTLLDARLTTTKGRVPDSINGVAIVGPKMSMQELLTFKAILFLEGNDVSSGVKWALYSQSVVLMPRPTATSWAMEELLEPWVHYVPIADDLSDVEEKIQWVLDHDTEAKDISSRATLWMYDLSLHPDAAVDDDAIFREILRRYRAHWSDRASADSENTLSRSSKRQA
jgi:Glycosyl transferase family 90